MPAFFNRLNKKPSFFIILLLAPIFRGPLSFYYFIMRYIILVLLLLLNLEVFAETHPDSSSCSAGYGCSIDPSPAGIMASHVHEKNQWMLSYRYMHTDFEGLVSGREQISNEEVFNTYLMSENVMRMDMHMLMAMYGLNDRLTIMGMTGFSVMSMEMQELAVASGHHHMDGMEESGKSAMHSSGLTDTRLSLLYGMLRKEHHHLLVSAGVNIPTGSIQLKGEDMSMYQHQRLPYSMQAGSGTLDVLPAVIYLFNRSSFTFSTQVSSVMRTGSNAAGYRLGNDYTSNTWLAHEWTDFLSSSLRVEANYTEPIKGIDATLYHFYEPSANPSNYGGTVLTAYLGSNLYLRKGVLKNNKLGAEFGLPLYQHLNGPQLAKQSGLLVSWSFMF